MATLIEVVDTAVKIGLGAALSSAGAVFLARMNHDRDLEKERLRRQRELLETVAEQVEAFSHVVLKYWGLLVEWARHQARGSEMAATRAAMLEEARSELFHAFKDLTSAEAKLLLLGEKEAQRLLRAYGEEVVRWRRNAYAGSTVLTEQRLADDRAVIMERRESFFDALSGLYIGRRSTYAIVTHPESDLPAP